LRQQTLEIDMAADTHLTPKIILPKIIVMAIFMITASTGVRAASPPTPAAPTTTGLSSLNEVNSGALLFRTTTPGRYVPAPLIATKVDMQVSGMIARVEVRQYFKNPSAAWLEGIYAFPLPDNAAVDQMRLQVGGQEIVARIAERAEARKQFEQAKSDGKRAALVEQHRPNLFTNSVANIGPGETVSVTLRYQQTLRYDNGDFHLRFPMVVAPRYKPGPITTTSVDQNGWATSRRPRVNLPVPDSPISLPVDEKINPVTMTINLNAGFPVTNLKSSYHAITSDDWSDGIATITLSDEMVPADRDFELIWTPKADAAPVAGVFQETIDGDAYLLAMVLPATTPVQSTPPRDIIFVLDRSGSMAGDSIRQAKQAIRMALDRLRPVDRFNIIRFSSETDQLFKGLRDASPFNLISARNTLEKTDANGGTKMAPALKLALSDKGREGRLKQIVFLTDGAVGNEEELLGIIRGMLGADRLFTIGIGSAPNSYFMRQAARVGRGSFTYIGEQSEIAERMTALFEKLEHPAMIDLRAATYDSFGVARQKVEIYPEILPDLYQSEPMMIAVKLPTITGLEISGSLLLTGVINDEQWRHQVKLSGAPTGDGVGAIWGRSKIESILDTLERGGDPEQIRTAVVDTALRHHLMSPYTSLIAIQNTIARDESSPLMMSKAPLNLPHGWNFDKVFGEILKRQAPPAQRAAAPAQSTISTDVMLPSGGTSSQLQILIGLALLAASGWVALRHRRLT
jgi:Ca-activated chloride channel homolog